MTIATKLSGKVGSGSILRGIVYIDVTICLYIELAKCYMNATWFGLLPDILCVFALIYIVNDKIIIQKRVTTCCLGGLATWIIVSSFRTTTLFFESYKRCRYILIGFLIFYICNHYITKSFLDKLIRLFFYTQIVHTLLVYYQFIILKVGVDMANGIFGYLNYNNAASGVFCLVLAILGLVCYVNGRRGIRSIFMIFMSCITAGISEIKAFFVLFVIGIAGLVVFNIKNKKVYAKMISIVMISLICMALGLYIMYSIIPENIYAFSGVDSWIQYEAYGTLQGGGIGRINQLMYIYRNIFDSNIIEMFVGKGAGYSTSICPYELGKFVINFGISGLVLLMLLLFAIMIECYKCGKDIAENVLCIILCILFFCSMVVWNATLNRMAICWFVFLSLGNNKCLMKNHRHMIEMDRYI